MKNCKHCAFLISRDICYFCEIDGREIEHPTFMGGPKRCECYTPYPKLARNPNKYPTKEDLKKYLSKP